MGSIHDLFLHNLLKILQKKEDFTDEEIDDFQCLADDFFRCWLQLTGYDGVTNYIHLIGAGHLRYYLKRWRNLNRYSNQGWESYNSMIGSFWHHRTGKGGGKNDKQQSKIKPIANWILRLMLWRTEVAQSYFRNLEDNSPSSEDDDYDSDVSF